MKGAILSDGCPDIGRVTTACRCKPLCRICGYGPHAAIHGPTMDDPREGAEIWKGGHLFMPEDANNAPDSED